MCDSRKYYTKPQLDEILPNVGIDHGEISAFRLNRFRYSSSNNTAIDIPKHIIITYNNTKETSLNRARNRDCTEAARAPY